MKWTVVIVEFDSSPPGAANRVGTRARMVRAGTPHFPS